jgi:hypothetical protein
MLRNSLRLSAEPYVAVLTADLIDWRCENLERIFETKLIIMFILTLNQRLYLLL